MMLRTRYNTESARLAVNQTIKASLCDRPRQASIMLETPGQVELVVTVVLYDGLVVPGGARRSPQYKHALIT